jgi:hypothetical protein
MRNELEYELIDTGVFDDDCYFDVFVEYAKAASPEDLLVRLTVTNWDPMWPRCICCPRCGFATHGRGWVAAPTAIWRVIQTSNPHPCAGEANKCEARE